MLQPWKSDSITSHGVPVTHCEQATILVLKLKVVQLRKFSFDPNIFSSFPLYCLNLEWICFLTRSFISPSVLCSTLSFLKNMHLEHNAFNWWNLSTWYALWSEDSNHIFQSWQPTWKPLTLFLKDVRADVHGQLFCHVEENQLYTVWCWDVSRHSMLRYHKMKVENFIKVFKTETFLWHVPAHHYIILVNMVEKFLNTKTSWTFKKNHHLAHNVF